MRITLWAILKWTAIKVIWHNATLTTLLQWLQERCSSQWEEGCLLPRGNFWEIPEPLGSVVLSFNFFVMLSNNFIQFFFSRLNTHIFSIYYDLFHQIIKIWSLFYVFLPLQKECWFLGIVWWQSHDRAGLAFISLGSPSGTQRNCGAPLTALSKTTNSVSNFWGILGHKQVSQQKDFNRKI